MPDRIFWKRRAQDVCFYVVFILFLFSKTGAATTESQICDSAAQQVASESEVPLDVLMALTRTETGRAQSGEVAPWPWAVNVQGQGYWFPDKAEAREFVNRQLRAGTRNVDVGCFQVNVRWHGHNFPSIDVMFDPVENARYASRYLLDMYEAEGDWLSAVGAYHSKTPKYAARYLKRFRDIMAALPAPPAARPRGLFQARAPVVRATGAGSAIGSLVPLGGSSGGQAFIQF